MFSGAQGHPAYDSSTGQPDDDGPEQRGDGEPGGERDGRAGGGAGNNDRSFLTQQPAEDEWSSSSDLGRLSGGDVCQPAASSSSATAAAAAAAALAEDKAEDEDDGDVEQEGGGQTGMADTAPAPPSSSNGMGWDSVAAAAGGGVSDEGGSRFSHPGRESAGGAGAVGGSGPRGRGGPMSSFRDGGGGVGAGSEDDGSPLIAPSDIMRHVRTAQQGLLFHCGEIAQVL